MQLNDYEIIEATSLRELQDIVNNMLNLNYKPIGGVTVVQNGDSTIFIQVLFR